MPLRPMHLCRLAAAALALLLLLSVVPAVPHAGTPTAPADTARAPAELSPAQQAEQMRLYQAIREGKLDDAKASLARGADVNFSDPDLGMTPLMLAAAGGDQEMITALLAAGAELEPQSRMGLTPLLAAALRNHRGAAITLLQAGANLGATDMRSHDALACAKAGQADECVRLFEDIGLLYGTCARGSIDSVTTLIEQGVPVQVARSGGHTPLAAAALSNHTDVMKLLLDAGAGVDLHTSDGTTALWLAASEGNAAAVKSLLAAGADRALKPVGGVTPLEIAKSHRHADAAKLLEGSARP